MRTLSVVYALFILRITCINHLVISCPSSCTCNPSYGSATCRGGDVRSTMQALPSYVSYLKLSTVQNAQHLKPAIFEQIALQQLINFTIIQSNVRQIDDNTFSKLHNLRLLDLSRNTLNSVAKNAFFNLSKLSVLDLSFNNINNIGDEFVPLSDLTELYLNENRLTDLNTGAFRQQAHLESLNLNGNTLSNLHGYVFQGLGNLKTLRLRRNGLEVIANDLFSVTRNLQTLDIGQNSLKQLPPAVEFRSIPSLRELDADGNEFVILTDNQFSGMHLATLNLSRNKINGLSKLVFQYGNARTLDLSFNQIKFIEEDVFRSLALEVLELSHNPLGTIPVHVFFGLYRLRKLNLAYCSLVQINEFQFQSLQYLEELDISHNSLQNIPQSTINLFSTMEKLAINDNKWLCDCRIAALKTWLDNYNPTTGMVSCDGCRDTRCYSPPDLAQRFITSLSNEEISICTHQSKTSTLSVGAIIGIGIASFIIFMIIIIVIIFCVRHSKTPPFKILCRQSSKDSSHKADLDENNVRPFKDIDVGSVSESDRGYVVRNFFRTMVSNPSVVSRGSPPLSQKDIRNSGSVQSLNSSVFSYPMGMESAV